MARDERARQKALARKRQRRAEKRALLGDREGSWRSPGLGLAGLPGLARFGEMLDGTPAPSLVGRFFGDPEIRARMKTIRSSANLSVHECVGTREMESQGIGPLLISRVQPDGNLVFGMFLVDLYCLGVKNAFSNADVPPREYERSLRRSAFAGSRPRALDPVLLCQIVYGAVDYAAGLGFEPHPDYELASCVLYPRSAVPPNPALRFGKDGKPLFISGPDDDTARVLRTLRRTVGEGNFDFIVGGPVSF